MCLPGHNRQKSKSLVPRLRRKSPKLNRNENKVFFQAKNVKLNDALDCVYENPKKKLNSFNFKRLIQQKLKLKSYLENDCWKLDASALSLSYCILVLNRIKSVLNKYRSILKLHFLIFVITIFSYSTSLNFNSEFVHDDLVAIVRNPDVYWRQTSIFNLFYNDYWGEPMSSVNSHKSYRPFTVLTFRLNMQIGNLIINARKQSLSNYSNLADAVREIQKTNFHLNELDSKFIKTNVKYLAWTFHLTNVFLHLIATQLFARILNTHLQFKNEHVLLASVYFSVHPIHTEAVSSIVGRADLLATIFMLICFMLYKRMLLFDQSQSSSSSQCTYLICFCCSAILALLSKENGLAIFPICIGHFIFKQILIYKSQKIKSTSNLDRKSKTLHTKVKPEEIKNQSKSLISCKSSSFQKLFSLPSSIEFLLANYHVLFVNIVLFTILTWFRIWMLNKQVPIFTSQDNPAAFDKCVYTRVFTYSYLAAFNLKLLIMPSTLSYDWQMNSISLLRSLSDARNLITLTGISILIYAFHQIFKIISTRNANHFKIAKQLERWYFSIAFLLIPFLPASNLLVTVGFVIAERTLYAPSVGFTVFWLLLYIRLSKSLVSLCCISRSFKQIKQLTKIAFYFLIICFTIKTMYRNLDWTSRKALFESGLRTLPHNAKIQYNYANLQKDLGKTDLAIHHYRNALKYWKDYESAHNNLAVLLDDLDEAEYHLKETLRLNPFHAKAYFNLANVYRKQKEVIDLLKRAIELNVNFAEPYSKLGTEYAKTGQNSLASMYHSKALNLQPYNPDFLNNYAIFLQQTGETKLAILQYQLALAINPSHRTVQHNLKQLLIT